MESLTITAAAAGMLGLLIVVLASRVSQLRMRHGISLGDGGDKALARAIRAHGNTVEWVPIFLVLCLLVEYRLGSSVVLGIAAAAFVAARLAFAWGLSRRTFSRPRQIGAGISYLVVAALSAALLFDLVR